MDSKSVISFVQKSRPVDPVPFNNPDWPSGLFVARLNGLEVDDWRSKLSDDKSINRMNAIWIAVCLLDADKDRIFDPNSEDDIKSLMTEMPFDVLQAAAQEVMTVNGMTNEAREEAVKN